MAEVDTKRRQRLGDDNLEIRILCKARRNKPLKTWQKYVNKAAAVIRALSGRSP